MRPNEAASRKEDWVLNRRLRIGTANAEHECDDDETAASADIVTPANDERGKLAGAGTDSDDDQRVREAVQTTDAMQVVNLERAKPAQAGPPTAKLSGAA